MPADFNGIREETAIHQKPGLTLRHDPGRPATFDVGPDRPGESGPSEPRPPFATPDPEWDRAGHRPFGRTGRAAAAPAGKPRQPDAA